MFFLDATVYVCDVNSTNHPHHQKFSPCQSQLRLDHCRPVGPFSAVKESHRLQQQMSHCAPWLTPTAVLDYRVYKYGKRGTPYSCDWIPWIMNDAICVVPTRGVQGNCGGVRVNPGSFSFHGNWSESQNILMAQFHLRFYSAAVLFVYAFSGFLLIGGG